MWGTILGNNETICTLYYKENQRVDYYVVNLKKMN